jgi:hypothetical protein
VFLARIFGEGGQNCIAYAIPAHMRRT